MSYARAWVNGQRMNMHRFLLQPLPCFHVDHVNRNGLDNRRSNLRLCTVSQNQFNRTKSATNTTGYKGVCWNKKKHKWQVGFTIKGRYKNLGYFDDKHEAAKAYNTGVMTYHKEFAVLNNIQEDAICLVSSQ